MNLLRLTLGSVTIASTQIATGAARNARRVSRAFARAVAAHPDAALEVQTQRGWQPRRIVSRSGAFYTRCV